MGATGFASANDYPHRTRRAIGMRDLNQECLVFAALSRRGDAHVFAVFGDGPSSELVPLLG